MAVNDPNSEANRLARLQSQGVNNRATQNLSTVVPPVVEPTPTQVAPVNTAPISPTTNINQLQHDANVANRQANPIVPVTQPVPTPLPYTNTPEGAPVTPQAVAPIQPVAPNTPAPTTNTTPKPVKTSKTTTPPVDFNAGLGREADISGNLEKFKTQGMNPDQIRQASGYNTADQNKKDQIDAFLGASTAPVLMDQKSIVNALISGQPVPLQKTQAYNNAIVQANEFKKFNGMTSSQLLDNLKQGQIGTEMSSLLAQNPNFAKAKAEQEKIQKTDSINRATQMASNVISGKVTPPVNDLANIEAKYSAPAGTDEKAYTDYVTKNEDVVTAGLQVKQLAKNISDVTTTYNQALKDLKSQYPDMPASALLTLMGSRTGETKSLLDSYINAQTTAKGDFDMAMKMAEGHYNAVSKDIAQANLLQNKKDELQLTADFQKKQAEDVLKDPATAIKSVMDEYKKLGIPFTSTVQSRLAEFKASGKPLEQFLTEMGQNIQASPAYQKYQALQQGQMSDSEKMKAQQSFDIAKIKLEAGLKDKNIQRVGGTTDNPIYGYLDGDKIVTVNVPGSTTSTNATATGNIVPVTVGNKTVRLDQSGATGFESAISQLTTAGIPIVVGEGERNQADTIKSMADRYGIAFNANNPAETAQKLRSAGHQVADPGKSNHESGMAIDVYGDNKLGKVTTAQEKILNENGWYSANIPGDAGHFEYKGQGSGNTSTTGNFSQKAIDLGQNILSGDAKLSDISGKSNEALKVEVMQYIANKNKTTQNTNVSQIQDTMKLINTLIDHPGRTAVTGVPGITNPFGYALPSSDAAGFKSKLEQLTAANFMVGIKSMKGLGALSDAEGAKVAASVSSLAKTNQSDEEYLTELNRLKGVLQNRLLSTEKETGIKYDENGFAVDPTQKQSNTAPVPIAYSQSDKELANLIMQQ